MATINLVKLESMAAAFDARKPLVVIGRKESVKAMSFVKASAVLASLVDTVSPGDDGATGSTLVEREDGSVSQVSFGIVPEKISRSNSRARPHAVTKMVSKLASMSESMPEWSCLACVEDAADVGAVACAIGRAFPLYIRKASQAAQTNCVLTVAFFLPDGTPLDAQVSVLEAVSAVRKAARLVDTPCAEFSTDAFVAEAQAVVERHPECKIEVARGEELRNKFGLIWGVGKAATQGPALVVLSHHREEGGESAVLVGKGITYDTGGLALKPKDGMFGMKMDMGAAAALLCAFEAAISVGDYGPYTSLHCILCVAENAIGPIACRHDDVIVGFSGKTVEINNTDAEGRLVLADGVAYASSPEFATNHGNKPVGIVLEAATLTGAQMVATGRRVAAIVTNSEEAEMKAVKAGLASGDLAHPLPFIPEFHRAEFESKVADMKNSVKDRGNAQSSCAATFIYEHLNPAYSGDWLHLDIAGPANNAERATGFGVAIVLAFLNVAPFNFE